MGIETPWTLGETDAAEAEPLLRTPTEGNDIASDYNSTGLTLRRHPLALLRERLAKQRIQTASEINRQPHGRLVHAAGLVTHRQRPGGAKVIFITMEDETGHINAIVRPAIAERDRGACLGAQLLGVTGVVQREGRVLHVVVGRLADHSGLLGSLTQPSRDFH
jgi:error-prone DNA polymerase